MTELNYNWTLKDAAFTKDKGTAFSCFAGGGGSTMGLKLAGFDVIGCNEIDAKMMNAYLANHDTTYVYLEGIQKFKLRENLPKELYNLDILDGSPPCSAFSICGFRRRDWGKKRRFREGQSVQLLEDLFFDFIDVAKKLQPKVCIAENVKGLLMKDAEQYVIKIYEEFDKAGYNVQHFLLDSSKMGVPQKRERVFFIALRKDLAPPFMKQSDLFTYAPELKLKFNHREITYSEIADNGGRQLTDHQLMLWRNRKHGDDCLADVNERVMGKRNDFSANFVYPDRLLRCITGEGKFIDFNAPQHISNASIIKAQSFPADYNFLKIKHNYLCGMSVPPVMMARVAKCIYEQWLSKM